MSLIRIRALQKLADQIALCVPALKGKICGGAAEAPKRLGFPSLGIYAVRFRYFPDQALLFKETGLSTAVFNVGRVEATVQLRLGAQTAQRRYELEQQIMENVFWADLSRPGVVLFSVEDCHDAVVAFEADAEEWDDERAFDKKWYSTMTVMAQLPALVRKGGIPTMEEIRLTLTEDLSTPIESIPAGEQETVSIATDGTITPAAGP